MITDMLNRSGAVLPSPLYQRAANLCGLTGMARLSPIIMLSCVQLGAELPVRGTSVFVDYSACAPVVQKGRTLLIISPRTLRRTSQFRQEADTAAQRWNFYW